MNLRSTAIALLASAAVLTAGCGADDKGPQGPGAARAKPAKPGEGYGNIVVLHSNTGSVSAKSIATACSSRGKEFETVAISGSEQGDLSQAVVTCRERPGQP